ncbi:MAG: NADH-quinone oxidoreductase subunit L [Dehalococcoidia bacterium]
MPHQLAWLIFLLPFFSFIVIAFILRPFLARWYRLAGYVTIAAIAGSLGLSLWFLSSVRGAGLDIPAVEWLSLGNLNVQIGLMADSLTAVMVVVVSLVSLMVQIYSQGYMKPVSGDTDYSTTGYMRYFAFMSLFTGSMLGLVMASNLLFLFLFWEGVGLCSYLLIGFWFHKASAANAAKKAFIVTRLGDLGFLLAILYLFLNAKTLDIAAIHGMAAAGLLSTAVITWAALGIFSGAVGKSAQFPLHVWLPDAMEGPTPVSALIHAATMVAAGAFLVARFFPLFAASETALTTLGVIGGVTAIFAATMGLVMYDIKRVIAYSTISQLGYMMLGLAVGGPALGIFHLFNHAFFKALLFLGAGSVNHATHTFDMREMGGLRKHMPWTTATFFVAALSLAGLWPLSGFWSKDEIIAEAWDGRRLMFVLVAVTAFLTAFYIFRVFFMTFGGQYRGKEHHLHESPPVMWLPMVLLGVLAIFSGWWGVNGGFGAFMGHGETSGFVGGFFAFLTDPVHHWVAWLSLALSGLGIFLAYAMYSARWLAPERVGRAFGPLYTLVFRKYFFDELYERVITVGALINGLFRGAEVVDDKVVDGAVNGVARGTLAGGRGLRRAQTGQLQLYGASIVLGLVALLVAVIFLG